MSKFLRLRVGFFLSAFLVAPGLMFAQGSIEGRVVNRVTGDGVAKAQVKVYAGRDLRYQAVTEPDGSFWISDAAKGSYTVTASAEGFTRPMLNGRLAAVMVGGPDVVRAAVELDPMVVLRGRVLDEEGKPAPDAQLELFCFPGMIETVRAPG
jgi:hypothetical protein